MYHSGVTREEDRFEQIIDLNQVQQIQDTFAQATGFASMMVSKTGRPLTRASHFRPICALIRSTEKGRARCGECDAAGGAAAYESGTTQTYVCTNGIIDIATPIVINGEYIGGIFCGQVLPEENHAELLEEIQRRNEYLGLSRDEILHLARQIPVLPHERIIAAANLLQLMASHIVQMGINRAEQSRREREEQEQLARSLQSTQQSLLNSHFLFNSLSLVSYTAFEENAPRTEEIVYCLSEMLRYSLRNLARSVALEQEIETIRNYLKIQQLRFGSRLRANIEIDPALNYASIPCMILQPLVENAIVHGLEPLSRPVTIQVRAFPWIEGMMIQISDDGAGITMASADAVNSRSFSYQNPRSGLGLKTIIQRLESEYGNRCVVRIEGGPGYGTTVMIYLPLCS